MTALNGSRTTKRRKGLHKDVTLACQTVLPLYFSLYFKSKRTLWLPSRINLSRRELLTLVLTCINIFKVYDKVKLGHFISRFSYKINKSAVCGQNSDVDLLCVVCRLLHLRRIAHYAIVNLLIYVHTSHTHSCPLWPPVVFLS